MDQLLTTIRQESDAEDYNPSVLSRKQQKQRQKELTATAAAALANSESRKRSADDDSEPERTPVAPKTLQFGDSAFVSRRAGAAPTPKPTHKSRTKAPRSDDDGGGGDQTQQSWTGPPETLAQMSALLHQQLQAALGEATASAAEAAAAGQAVLVQQLQQQLADQQEQHQQQLAQQQASFIRLRNDIQQLQALAPPRVSGPAAAPAQSTPPVAQPLTPAARVVDVHSEQRSLSKDISAALDKLQNATDETFAASAQGLPGWLMNAQSLLAVARRSPYFAGEVELFTINAIVNKGPSHTLRSVLDERVRADPSVAPTLDEMCGLWTAKIGAGAGSLAMRSTMLFSLFLGDPRYRSIQQYVTEFRSRFQLLAPHISEQFAVELFLRSIPSPIEVKIRESATSTITTLDTAFLALNRYFELNHPNISHIEPTRFIPVLQAAFGPPRMRPFMDDRAEQLFHSSHLHQHTAAAPRDPSAASAPGRAPSTAALSHHAGPPRQGAPRPPPQGPQRRRLLAPLPHHSQMTCHQCGMVGHIHMFCPKNPNGVRPPSAHTATQARAAASLPKPSNPSTPARQGQPVAFVSELDDGDATLTYAGCCFKDACDQCTEAADGPYGESGAVGVGDAGVEVMLVDTPVHLTGQPDRASHLLTPDRGTPFAVPDTTNTSSLSSSAPVRRVKAYIGVIGLHGVVSVTAIPDSGATHVCIRPELAEQLKLVPRKQVSVKVAGGTRNGTLMVSPEGATPGETRITLIVAGAYYHVPVVLAVPLPEGHDILLGANFIEATKLNTHTGEMTRPSGATTNIYESFGGLPAAAHVSTAPLAAQAHHAQVAAEAYSDLQALHDKRGEQLPASKGGEDADVSDVSTAPSMRPDELAAQLFLTAAFYTALDLYDRSDSGAPGRNLNDARRPPPAADEHDADTTLGDENFLGDPDSIPEFAPKGANTHYPADEYERLVNNSCKNAGNNAKDRQATKDLIMEFPEVFNHKSLPADKPLLAPEVTIPTSLDAPLTARRGVSRLSPAQLEAANATLDKQLAAGIIEPCPPDISLPFNSPLLFVKKRDEHGNVSMRAVNDFRGLNEVTVKRSPVLTDVHEILEFNADRKFKSKMDLTSAFHQMVIKEEDRPKTAFASTRGYYMYVRAPMGPTNMPAEFNKRMADIFHPAYDIMRFFFDDLTCATNGDYQAHLAALRRILQLCKEHNIILSLAKCSFGQQKITILGHIVSYHNITMADKSREAIQHLSPPTTRKQLERIMGLFNYWRTHIFGFAELARPLNKLLGDDVPFIMGEEQVQAFYTLQRLLAASTGLCPPLMHRGTYRIITDASSDTIAGVVVLEYPDDNGRTVKRIVQFLSRNLTLTERNYCTTDREELAIVWTLSKVGKLIHGEKIIICTDHQALSFLLNSAEVLGTRRARWLAILQTFHPTIEYVAGKSTMMSMVDALTRQPIDSLPSLQRTSTIQLNTPTTASAEPLQFVAPMAIPRDNQHARDKRPTQASFTTAPSVLDEVESAQAMAVVLRSHRRAVAPAPPPVASPASPAETGDPDPVPAAAPPAATSGHPAAAAPVPTAAHQQLASATAGLVWHNDIWLSSASLYGLRHQTIPAPLHGGSKARQRVADDIKRYTITLDDSNKICAIQSRHVGLNGAEQSFEYPAPSRRPDIVALSHLRGHFGTYKTARLVEENGQTWFGLLADVATCVKACSACQRDNVHAAVHHAATAIPIPAGNFDCVHMDILDLGESEVNDKYGRPLRYVLLCVDRLSKFPAAVCLANKDAASIAEALFEIISIFGPPTVLISDHGAEFVNDTIKALSLVHGIEHRLTSPYRPQANGQVERMNLTVATILRKCTADAPKRWPSWMPSVLLAIRCTVHSATGFTPHEVMFGRPPRPFANFQAIADWTGPNVLDDDADLLSHIVQFLHRAKDVAAQARTAATSAQQQQNATQDNRHTLAEHSLEPDVWVFLREEQPSCKLAHRFVGPFKVVSRLPIPGSDAPGNYCIADENGRQLEQTFPRDKLFAVASRGVSLSRRQSRLYSSEEWHDARAKCSEVHTGPLPTTDGFASNSYIVEAILQRAPATAPAGAGRVLVKWSGRTKPEWIPESDVVPDDLRRLLRAWRLSTALQQGTSHASRLRRTAERD